MSVTELKAFRRERAERNVADTHIVREDDSDNDRISYYGIDGPSKAAVQSVIDSLIAEVESFGDGYGLFRGPSRTPNGRYIAFGKVVAGFCDA
jgi:hypothetical protein